ncbi:kelch-like protein 18 [Diadema antillarum]|uniref:kelch-like protein 18 n=1 Tax=Diadema antillarum TaxID=105358 RepID=UPI003A8575DC
MDLGETPGSARLDPGPGTTSTKRPRIQDQAVSSSEDDETVLMQQRHAVAVLALMRSMHEQQQLCDVTLSVEDKLIPAHRLVLSAFSPYFHAMFTSKLRESTAEVVTLRGMNGDAVEAIVNFAYRATIDIDEDNVQSVLSNASVLQIEAVINLCCEFLKTQLHPTNCLGIRNFAVLHGCFDLKEAADVFVQQNFTKVVAHEEFLQLSSKDLITLIEKDTLNIAKEEEVYLAVMCWLRHDLAARHTHIADIFEHVRLPLLAWEFLNSRVIEEEVLMEEERFRKFVDEARRYHGSKFYPGLHWEVSMRTVPRHSCSRAQFIYVVGGEISPSRNTLCSAECYQPAINNWSPLPPMKQSRRGVGVVVVDNIIYAIGGADASPLRDVECFDPQTDSWRQVAKMKVARSSVAVARVGGQVYACGGYDGTRSVKSVEQYDPNLNEWKYIKDMATQRSMATAVSHGEDLYVIGGYDGTSDLKIVERYQPALKMWTFVSPMHVARSMAAAACLKDKIYVIGGCEHSRSLSSVEVYHPALDLWTQVTPLVHPRSGVGAAVVHNRLFAVGGYDGEEGLRSVERYEEEKDEWTVVTHMEIARRRFGCCS